MNTREAMSEAIAVLDAPGSQGVGRTMYLKTRWTKVEEPSRSGRLLSRAGGQDTCKRVYVRVRPNHRRLQRYREAASHCQPQILGVVACCGVVWWRYRSHNRTF